MIGHILQTLQCRVDKDEAEWRSHNLIRKQYSYSFPRRLFNRIAEKPLRWSLSALIILLLFVTAMCFLPISWLPVVARNLTATDLVAYFSALWSVQAAVAGVVYPIVIAFVILLLQQRQSAKATLHIYLYDSAAVISALSALCLIFFMAIQYLFLPNMRLEVTNAWILVDGAWFLGNLLLSVFFIFRTFQFVRPSVRSEIIRRYAVTVAWPKELKEHLASHLFLTAKEHGFLAKIDQAEEEEQKQPTIWLGPFHFGLGKPSVTKRLKGSRALTDVRFRFLDRASRTWLKRATKYQPSSKENDSRRGIGRDADQMILIYPLRPGSIYEGTVDLCRIKGPVQLSWFEKALIELSFKFKRPVAPLQITVKTIFDDLKAEAQQALQLSDPGAFSIYIREIVDLYTLLLKASEFVDEQRERDNYARIDSRLTAFGMPVYQAWSECITDLSRLGVEKLFVEDSFFEDVMYASTKMLGQLSDAAHSDLLVHFIDLTYRSAADLGSWWVKAIEQQGVTRHSPSDPASLLPPFFGTYDSIFRVYIGVWESLKNYHFYPGRNGSGEWKELLFAANLYERHLHHTSVMLMQCIHRGDETGMEWILDVLLKWFPELESQFDVYPYFLKRERLVTFETTRKSWEEAKLAIDIEGGGFTDEDSPKALFAVALRNYWIDACCVVSYITAMLGRKGITENSLQVRLLKHVLSGTTPRSGSEPFQGGRAIGDATELLTAIIRQYHSQGAYREGYRARLDGLVERVRSLTKERMVSSRVYSGWGADDLSSTTDGQLVLLALFLTDSWKPVGEIYNTISKWVSSDNTKVRELRHDLKQWKQRIEQPEFEEYRLLFNLVKGKIEEEDFFSRAVESLSKWISTIVDEIDKIMADTIRSVKIDEARLIQVGKWASADAFGKASGAFPLPLFEKVEAVERQLSPRSLTLKGVAKGEYTCPLMSSLPINEDEWFGKTMRDYVAANILDEVIRKLSPEKRDGGSPEKYWKNISHYAEEMEQAGKQAILIIENPTIPFWIYDWTDRYRGPGQDVPRDLKAWHSPDINSESYLGHLNNVAVYSARIPSGSSYLLASESFMSLEYTRFPDGRSVTLDPISTENEGIIDLKLTCWLDIKVDLYPSVKLTYGKKGRQFK